MLRMWALKNNKEKKRWCKFYLRVCQLVFVVLDDFFFFFFLVLFVCLSVLTMEMNKRKSTRDDLPGIPKRRKQSSVEVRYIRKYDLKVEVHFMFVVCVFVQYAR